MMIQRNGSAERPGPFYHRDPGAPGDGSIETIGRSANGRIIRAIHAGPENAALRVVVIAGQHGDEAPARQAAVRFLRLHAEAPDEARLPESVRAAVIPDVNPDGSALGTRENADGIDLNRDHRDLRALETRAVHRFVRRFDPAAIIDLHNYPSRRRHLLSRHRVLDSDVLLGVPTNPAVGPPELSGALTDLVGEVRAKLAFSGSSVGPYLVFQRSGRVRLGTLRTTDARNGLALRYSTLSILVEGRSPRRDEGPDEQERLVRAQTEALTAVLAWVASKGIRWFRGSSVGRDDPPGVPIRVRWSPEGPPVDTAVLDPRSDRHTVEPVPGALVSARVVRAVTLPAAYAVPDRLRALGEVLERHGFMGTSAAAVEPAAVETYRIESTSASFWRSRLRTFRSRTPPPIPALESYRAYPTAQPGSRALAVWLEPDSPFGFAGRGDLGLELRPGQPYPVLRLLK